MIARCASWACLFLEQPIPQDILRRSSITSHHVKPDAVYLSELMGKVIIVDQLVPYDGNIVKGSEEKVQRYDWLREPLSEYAKVPISEVVVIPIAIGAMGGVPQKVIDDLVSLSFPHAEVHKAVKMASAAAVQSTCNIVRARTQAIKNRYT